MASGKKSVLDALVAGSDDSDSDSGGVAEKTADAAKAPASETRGGDGEASGSGGEADDAQDGGGKRRKGAITLEDLQRAGYKSGPSVLLMRPPEEQGQSDWTWSNGREAKAQESEETWQERQETRHIATAGADLTATLARKASAHAAKLREERRLEKEQARQDARLSWSQKEKRKREEGKVSRSGSYVEEEKRLARSHGVFSGFD